MAEQQEKQKQQIEKPWCVYGGFLNYWGYGKIIKENQISVQIICTEKQVISALWDPRYVKRFDTLLETLKEFHQNRRLRGNKVVSWEKLKASARENFPNENLEDGL